MNVADVLKRPIITEKSVSQLNSDNEFVFEVGVDANKVSIKKAIEAFYGVNVHSVRTLVVRGKVRRHGRHFGKRRNWKKAYVRLAAGQTLNVYDV
jgi:large subunit ribosomal protein L23